MRYVYFKNDGIVDVPFQANQFTNEYSFRMSSTNSTNLIFPANQISEVLLSFDLKPSVIFNISSPFYHYSISVIISHESYNIQLSLVFKLSDSILNNQMR